MLSSTRDRIWLLGLLAFFLSIHCGCMKPPWKEFESKDGGYKVSMPELPTKMPKVIKTAIGPVEVVFHNRLYKKVSFITGYVDYPKPYVKGTTAASILSGARDGGVADANATLESEKKITQGEYPGRAITMRSKDGKQLFQSRIFLAGQRFYQALVVTPATGEYKDDAERFLNSFQITSKFAKLAGDKAPWGEYKSAQGGFVVLTAGAPRFTKEPLSTEYGFLELHSYPFEDEGFNYVISHVDYPEENVKKLGAEKLLDSVQAGAEAKAGGKAHDIKKVMTSGFSGREFLIDPKDSRFQMRMRLFMAHHRLYELVAVYPKSATDKTNVEVFLKSFRVTMK